MSEEHILWDNAKLTAKVLEIERQLAKLTKRKEASS